MNKNESAEIALNCPLEVAGHKRAKVTMRRPKVKDMRLARVGTGEDDVAAEVKLFANLCELSAEEMDALDWSDYQQLQKAYAGFLG